MNNSMKLALILTLGERTSVPQKKVDQQEETRIQYCASVCIAKRHKRKKDDNTKVVE